MLPFCSRWLLIGFFILGGPNSKTAIAILNCLLARQYCFEDSSCSAILEIIPRVCGSEIVACSTVTVTKCQAALRTLQAFPFFKPTCLCREPHVDPDCNSFRDFLFDHPCVFVSKKEKDPYPVDALPSCNHALYVCQQEQKCIKIYDDFKSNCKVRDNKCRMDDRNICHDSWSNLRQTPMFGCICPNNHMKKRCDRIFSMVNHNPCVATMHPFYAQITNLLEQEPESAVPHNPYLFLLPPSLTHTTASDTPTQGTESTDNREYRLRYPKLDDTDASDNSSFDFGLGNIRNPLVDADSLTELLAHSDLDHDVSVNVLKNKGKAQTPITYPDEDFYPNNIMQQKYPSAPDHESNDLSKIIFQSTCHKVMESCLDNTVCRRSLSPILHHCDMSRCNRHSCMEALQAFYRKQNFHWNTDIAFCLCKKTDNKQDACLIAQEKLHPVCAQRVEGSPQPTCLSLAETCREDKECRGSLERYEQSCAVDSVTKKCAGSPRDCRNAMLGILGTNLRTSCACKGTDMTQLYDCMGWQRLLWVNPCVVESQKEFHTANMLEEARHTTSTPRTTTLRITTAPSIRTRPTPPPVHITVMTATEARENTIPELIPPPQPYIPTTTPSTTTISTTTTTRRTTTTKLTTTTLATTTIPPKFCLVKSTQFPDQQIKEGTLKRIYHAEVDHCSDICHCDVPEKLSCKTICIDRMPCQTDFAFYNHEAPAYQAFRGRCLCYSGRFICMKPSPGNYFLPPGIFLFLGYSEEDEHKLMKIQAKIVIEDVVKTLQKVIEEEAVNGTFCYLELYNITKENVIISGKVSEIDYVTMPIPEILAKEKDECSQWMEIVADKINSQNQEFMSHLLLSVFKMAEVEIIQIEEKSAAFSIRHTILSFILPLVLLIIHFPKFMTSS